MVDMSLQLAELVWICKLEMVRSAYKVDVVTI